MAPPVTEDKTTRHLSTAAGAVDEEAIAAQMRPEGAPLSDEASRADAAGKSIEQLADEPPEEVPLPPMQLPLPGTREGIGTSFGGARPTLSEVRIMGGKQPISGSFDKGEEIELYVKVKVTGVLGQDTVDAWGATQSTIRRHFGRIIECKTIEQHVRG